MIWSCRVIWVAFDMTAPDQTTEPGKKGQVARARRAQHISPSSIPNIFNNLGLIEQTVLCEQEYLLFNDQVKF